MQSLTRAMFSLRGACSSSGRIASRAFSEGAADGGPAAAEGVVEGAKSKLHRLLVAADKPLTAAEVWALAQEEGLRSKRFTKYMLRQMRMRGHVEAVPMGGAAAGKHRSSFGYLLAGSPAAEAHLAGRQAAAAAAPKKR